MTASHPNLEPALSCRRGPGAPRVHIWQNLMCVTYLTILQRMENFFLRNGCRIETAPEGADWILVGGCAAFYHQIDDFFEKIDAFAGLGAKIAVYGCLPRVATERYRQAREKIALYIDTRHPEQVERMLASVHVPWGEVPDGTGFRSCDYRHYDPAKKYLVVQEGCDATCTFCPHKQGIGPARSLARERLLCQVRDLVRQGMKTLLLEGRDLGSWGQDFHPPDTISRLLADILAVEGDFRVFINQLGANWVLRQQESLQQVLLHPKVGDIHIPIQTISDRLLALMGRETGTRKLAPFLQSLGRGQAGRVLRTDMLVGFPTETEEEFEETLAFILEHFDEVAVYGFELHPFTEIATMDVPRHDRATIESRVERALAAIGSTPGIIYHRGGQVPGTMIDRERHKAQLGRA